MGRPKGSKDTKPRAPRALDKHRSAQSRAEHQAQLTNGMDPARVENILKSLLESHNERQSIMMTAAANCKPLHTRDRDMLAVAKSDGYPVRALRARFKQLLHERAARKIADDLEPDDQEQLGLILEATKKSLGADFADNLPLGQAAMTAAERGARAAATLTVDRGPDHPIPDLH